MFSFLFRFLFRDRFIIARRHSQMVICSPAFPRIFVTFPLQRTVNSPSASETIRASFTR